VNSQHLGAFVWLRWRIRVNQLKRGGTANAVIMAVLAGGAVLLGLALAVALFLVGLLALPKARPPTILYVWDGLVFLFLFFWLIGLVTDLQRSEALSLEKFLHLPVSPAGAFLVNYLSSLPSLSLVLFLPGMVGLSLGLVFGQGPGLLVLLPAVAAFFFMVTALTYQFQGWLAALMANPRRRRTVIVVVTVVFVLLFQLPNIVMRVLWRGDKDPQKKLAARLTREKIELEHAFSVGQITVTELRAGLEQLQRKYAARAEEENRQESQEVERTTRLINLVLPPGWLPLGGSAAAEGDIPVAWLATAGLALIGTASLWRAYRTTLRFYTGQYTTGKKRPVAAPKPSATPRRVLLERDLPGLAEQPAVIALAGFRSLTRAPEAKMTLLTPIILLAVFGSMMLTQPMHVAPSVRPLMAFGAMATILTNVVQLLGNQFGFERGGFRVFVLSPAPRRDILLGKNLAVAPLALVLGVAMLALAEVLFPMRLDHLLAALPQLLSMFLLTCLVANWLSMLAPMRLGRQSFKPVNAGGLTILFHILFFVLFLLALAPMLLPLGAEVLMEYLGWIRGIPVCLVLSLAECVGIVYLYRVVLTWQGRQLQRREQDILQVVTPKAE
jgi:hypothetical protein